MLAFSQKLWLMDLPNCGTHPDYVFSVIWPRISLSLKGSASLRPVNLNIQEQD